MTERKNILNQIREIQERLEETERKRRELKNDLEYAFINLRSLWDIEIKDRLRNVNESNF